MDLPGPVPLDAVIFGGGAAGLWLLHDLRHAGYEAVVLESASLGAGQTIRSQGIIHGGLKYSLGELISPAARAIRDMPLRWRRSLAGEWPPDLSTVRLRAEFCYLWQTASFKSRLGMMGARAGLRARPALLPAESRPDVLRACPGVVARVDEQVIEPHSLIGVLADLSKGYAIRIDRRSGLEFKASSPGTIDLVRLINPHNGRPLDLRPRHVIFTAGRGNAALRERVGLEGSTMQRRPLHMVLARGPLPPLNGHCMDAMGVRATITSTRDFADRMIWQIGGQIAEDGVHMHTRDLIRHVQSELAAILPGLELQEVKWGTYRADRAEAASGGKRPSEARAMREGNTITGWPTKLALVPQLVEQIRADLPEPAGFEPIDLGMLSEWPAPIVAIPPWEEQTWFADDSAARD